LSLANFQQRPSAQRTSNGGASLKVGFVYSPPISQRRLDAVKDDLKLDYEVKKEMCKNLVECVKNTGKEIAKVYERLQDPHLSESPFLEETLCLASETDSGLADLVEFQKFDQTSFCKKELDAECELLLYEAQIDGKALFFKGTFEEDCGDVLPCLEKHEFKKEQPSFVKEGFEEVTDCTFFSDSFSDESAYLSIEVEFDPIEVADFCFGSGPV